jgi:hypothetical protein
MELDPQVARVDLARRRSEMPIKVVLALALCASCCAQAAEEFDLSKLDRTIAKQPPYHAEQPLFGLAVIGSSAHNRVWMVLDKSQSSADHYDLLYADLNGNGDLTEPGERFHQKPSATGRVKFDLPDFTDAQSGETHTEFYLTVSDREPKTQMVSLKWRGEHKFGGGYPEDPADGYMQFATTPDDAPIAHLNGNGPFQFQRWYSSEFQIGSADDLKLFLGLPGVGNSSFTAFQRHVLQEGEPVLATLIYLDQDGQERTTDFKLKERC